MDLNTPFKLIDLITISHTLELFIKVSSKHGHIHKDTNIHTRTHTQLRIVCVIQYGYIVQMGKE